MNDKKPPRVQGWGPWRRSYGAASRDAERLTRERGLNHLVTHKYYVGDDKKLTDWWVAAQLPKKRRKQPT